MKHTIETCAHLFAVAQWRLVDAARESARRRAARDVRRGRRKARAGRVARGARARGARDARQVWCDRARSAVQWRTAQGGEAQGVRCEAGPPVPVRTDVLIGALAKFGNWIHHLWMPWPMALKT